MCQPVSNVTQGSNFSIFILSVQRKSGEFLFSSIVTPFFLFRLYFFKERAFKFRMYLYVCSCALSVPWRVLGLDFCIRVAYAAFHTRVTFESFTYLNKTWPTPSPRNSACPPILHVHRRWSISYATAKGEAIYLLCRLGSREALAGLDTNSTASTEAEIKIACVKTMLQLVSRRVFVAEKCDHQLDTERKVKTLDWEKQPSYWFQQQAGGRLIRERLHETLRTSSKKKCERELVW